MARMRKAPESNPLGNPALPVPEPKAPKRMMKKQESKAEVVNVISTVPAQSNVIAKPKRAYVRKAKAPARERSESPKPAPKRKYVRKAKAPTPAPEIVSPPTIRITPIPTPKREMKPTQANVAKQLKKLEAMEKEAERLTSIIRSGDVMMKSAKSGQAHSDKAVKAMVKNDIKEQLMENKAVKEGMRASIKKMRVDIRQLNAEDKKLREKSREMAKAYKHHRAPTVTYHHKMGLDMGSGKRETYALPENEMMFL